MSPGLKFFSFVGVGVPFKYSEEKLFEPLSTGDPPDMSKRRLGPRGGLDSLAGSASASPNEGKATLLKSTMLKRNC